jgi:hypothetical protein
MTVVSAKMVTPVELSLAIPNDRLLAMLSSASPPVSLDGRSQGACGADRRLGALPGLSLGGELGRASSHHRDPLATVGGPAGRRRRLGGRRSPPAKNDWILFHRAPRRLRDGARAHCP